MNDTVGSFPCVNNWCQTPIVLFLEISGYSYNFEGHTKYSLLYEKITPFPACCVCDNVGFM